MKKSLISLFAVLIICTTILTCGNKGTNSVNAGKTWHILYKAGYNTMLTKIIPFGANYIIGGILGGYSYIAKINNEGQLLWEHKILEYSDYKDVY